MNTTRRHYWKGAVALAALTLLTHPLAGSAAEESATTQDIQDAAAHRGSVARSVFTSGIVDREPIDTLVQVPSSLQRLYFFSDLRDLEGQIVTHRWEYEGKVMAEVKFRVGGPRWRVYSSKNLLPEWLGKWTVVVLDESGWPIKASMFEYVAQPQATTASPY